MKLSFDKAGNECTVKAALDKTEWDAELQKAYERTKGKYKIPGFRPGKAPRKFIEMHYGAGVFFDDAADLCIGRVYREEMSKHPELEVFGQPEVSFDKPEEGDAIAFSVKVCLYPELTLGEYKGIKLPKIEYNVSDGDVDDRIALELKQASRNVPVDRPAANGDITVIDYVGTVDGVEFEGGKAEKHELKLGSGSFIPGFEDGLVGAKAGEERDVNVRFPDEYHAAELKGKDAVFHVKVNEVLSEEIPELTDEFVKERGRYETVEEYKAATREGLEKAAAARQRNDRIDAAMKVIVDNASCDTVDKIVDAEVERLYEEFEHQMSHYGISPEDYLKYNDSTPEKFREERRPVAERNVKMRQLMRAIIEAEKIEVTPDEVRQKLRDPNVRAALEHEVRHGGGSVEEYAFNDMLTDKFFDFLLNNNEFVLDPQEEKAEEKPGSAEKPAKKSTKAAKAEEANAEPATEEKSEPVKKPAKKTTKKSQD